MKSLAVAIALCALAASGNAGADQTCKAKAVQHKLTGEALLNFVKQCEFDALAACGKRGGRRLLVTPHTQPPL